MVKQTIAAITPEECDNILAQISALVDRLQLRHGNDLNDLNDRNGNVVDNADNDDGASLATASRPPTPPPSDAGSASGRPTFAFAHGNSGSAGLSPLRGSTIAVQTSGPTVVPILPNARFLHASAHDSAILTGRYAYSSEYCEPIPPSPEPCRPGRSVAIAPITNGPWYAVVRGKETVSPLVLHVSGSIYRRHPSRQSAEQAFEAALQAGDVAVVF
ncbi:hypothetical protein PUNSTDRAFT_130702 [Punctularia strigosozonata HHB-11173 SS5]|uniref:uncharacterized protein n=1 Tax=Punctularia strigosozonata (strain HHB-11173) TaxID=741275 RepID=UPI0004417CCB|nr:uncharacterized protein PUNSTDRAFT_130702 [Punctularia strigosozonata HHB-11173 SS5]EIN12443.1 hypothetical protein PUNSTDRAFT_130702 [Punctularia strigosozonata HHB-11173 SS5]